MKTKKELLAYVVAFCVFLIASPNIASALPSCSDLATDPAYGLAGNPVITPVLEHLITGVDVQRREVIFDALGKVDDRHVVGMKIVDAVFL